MSWENCSDYNNIFSMITQTWSYEASILSHHFQGFIHTNTPLKFSQLYQSYAQLYEIFSNIFRVENPGLCNPMF